MLTGFISSGSDYFVAHVGQQLPKYRNYDQTFTIWGALVTIMLDEKINSM